MTGTTCSIRGFFGLWVGLLLLTNLFTGSFATPTFFEALGGPNIDYAYALTETMDGGLALAGNTASFGAGGSDAFLAKFDTNGTLLFARTLGGSNSEYINAVAETIDGGLAMAGYTDSFGAGNYDAFLAKFDANGTLIFARTLGGPVDDRANALIETSDGGLAMLGFTRSFGAGGDDAFLAKFDMNGGLIFARALGGPDDDLAHALTETSDGGLAMAGNTASFGAGGTDVFLAKFDANGTLIFARTMGGPLGDMAKALVETMDGGLAMSGYTRSFGAGGADAFLAKFDDNGTLLFAHTIGGQYYDLAFALTETDGGGLAMAGNTASFGSGSTAAFLAKFDANGTLLLARTLGGSSFDYAVALVKTMDGGLAMAGYTSSFGAGGYDAFLAKWSDEGTLSNCSYVGYITAATQIMNATVSSVTYNATAFTPSISSIIPNGKNVTPYTTTVCLHPPSTTPAAAPTAAPTSSSVPSSVSPTTLDSTTTLPSLESNSGDDDSGTAQLLVLIGISLLVVAVLVSASIVVYRMCTGHRQQRRQRTKEGSSIASTMEVAPRSLRSSHRYSVRASRRQSAHFARLPRPAGSSSAASQDTQSPGNVYATMLVLAQPAIDYDTVVPKRPSAPSGYGRAPGVAEDAYDSVSARLDDDGEKQQHYDVASDPL